VRAHAHAQTKRRQAEQRRRQAVTTNHLFSGLPKWKKWEKAILVNNETIVKFGYNGYGCNEFITAVKKK